MNYQQTLDYLYAQLPMFSRIGAAAYKKDLHNTIALCEALDNPHTKFKSIHIAGTNGKGSTSHMLAAILQQAGYKTGLYTSPHLKDFRERIRINGEMISRDFVVNFVQRTMTLSEAIQPSFFELTVAMAFDYFAKEKVDIAIIETGLGGRLDSTNVIHPVLSVITNISLDHTALLGNTLEEIAFEKGGIIKENTPVVIGKQNVNTDGIFEKQANEKQAKIYFSANAFSFGKIDVHDKYSDFYFHGETDFFIRSDLRAAYQQENIRTVYMALQVLENEKIMQLNAKKNAAGFLHCTTNTQFQGRWQTLSNNPKIIADVAHNEDGVKNMLEQLQYEKYKQLHIVYGAVKDKDVDAILKLLPKSAHYYFTEPPVPRKLEATHLAEKAKKFSLKGKIYAHPKLALAAAKATAKESDLILVTGSFFVLAEVL